MKTITIWNVPLEIAESVAQMMWKLTANRIKDGADLEEVTDLMYEIARIENDVREARQPVVEPEEVEDNED